MELLFAEVYGNTGHCPIMDSLAMGNSLQHFSTRF